TILVTLISPRLCARIGRLLRDGSKFPNLRSGTRIEGASPTRIPVGTDDQKAFVNDGRGLIRHDHVDFAFLSEGRYGLARIGVDGDQSLAGREKDSRWNGTIARPEGDTAPRRFVILELVGPDFFSGFRFERDDTVVRGEIHHAVYDDRREFRAARDSLGFDFTDFVCPGAYQPSDVPGVDLIER